MTVMHIIGIFYHHSLATKALFETGVYLENPQLYLPIKKDQVLQI